MCKYDVSEPQPTFTDFGSHNQLAGDILPMDPINIATTSPCAQRPAVITFSSKDVSLSPSMQLHRGPRSEDQVSLKH